MSNTNPTATVADTPAAAHAYTSGVTIQEQCVLCGADESRYRDPRGNRLTYCGPCALRDARDDSSMAYAVTEVLRGALIQAMGWVNVNDVVELAHDVAREDRKGLRKPLTFAELQALKRALEDDYPDRLATAPGEAAGR